MLGEVLKQAREEKNMTQKDVAENTNLLVQIVDDLEKDDFHRIAAAIYGKGFVRLYAECVGLPQEQIKLLIREFTMLYDGAKPSQVQTKPVPLPKSAPKPTPPAPSAPAVRTVQPPTPTVATRPVVIEPPPKREPSPVPAVRPVPQSRIVVTPPKPVAPVAVELPPSPPPVPEADQRTIAVTPIVETPIVETPAEPQPEPSPVAQTPSSVPEEEPLADAEPPEVQPPIPSPVEEKPIAVEQPVTEEVAAVPETTEKPLEQKADTAQAVPMPEVRKPAPVPVIEEPLEPVKPDLSTPVVEMEETETPVDEDDLFSMARRIVSIRQGGATEIPDDPESVPEVRKPIPDLPREEPEEKPAKSRTPFSVVFKQAVQISMEKISKTAQSSVEVSQRSFAPIKRLFSTKQAWLYTGAGLLVAILLVVGIRMIFRVTEQQTTIREGAANFPPPPMYVE
ncbi:MAG: helix-turn-helix domain-containing protein [Kiritimatiellae bacterium]|nr:helix-turn-helix domain-containing protein [Kiritimatiellia bacterium]